RARSSGATASSPSSKGCSSARPPAAASSRPSSARQAWASPGWPRSCGRASPAVRAFSTAAASRMARGSPSGRSPSWCGGRPGAADDQPGDGARRGLEEIAEPAVAGPIAAAIGLSEEPGDRDVIAWAFRRLLEQLAAERPLVVVVEDLHWAEPTLLEVLA